VLMSGEMADFDSVLWSALPPDIWERVLACLPEKALCRFRTVCKAWRSLLSNYSFRELRGGLHQKESTILVSNGHKAVAVYDRDENKWSVIDILFLRAAFSAIGVKNYKIEAAEGSLLAVWSASKNEKVKAVVICNPVAKTWRYLPSMVIHMAIRTVVHMVVDSETSALRIFVLGFENHTATEPLFQIYDSVLASWRLCNYPSRIFQSSRPLSGLLYNGTFHTLFYDIVAQNHVLMAYKMAEDVWADVHVHFPRFFVTGQLLVAKSLLYLVTPCKETGGQPSRYVLNLDISEIRIPAGECTRVAELPSSVFNLLFGSSHRVSLDAWVTMVFDQSICFLSYLGHAVVHDEVANQWQPIIPYSISKGGQLFGSSFSIDVCMPV
jgi:hypothetical protein